MRLLVFLGRRGIAQREKGWLKSLSFQLGLFTLDGLRLVNDKDRIGPLPEYQSGGGNGTRPASWDTPCVLAGGVETPACCNHDVDGAVGGKAVNLLSWAEL
jgi:hypothetical protein